MEMEIEDTAVIAANGTRASRFSDEDPLDLLMSSCDGLANTALATPALPALTGAVQMECD
jgi:hypothetical protein